MITTKAELLEEFDRVVENYDDVILFYLQEYKHIMPYDDIATYLVEAFQNRVWTFASELLNREEEEEENEI